MPMLLLSTLLLIIKKVTVSFNSSNMSERAFRKIYLKEYEIAIKNANSKAIMSSYNLVNGIHVNENAGIIDNILREEIHYNNIVMTD